MEMVKYLLSMNEIIMYLKVDYNMYRLLWWTVGLAKPNLYQLIINELNAA